MARRPTFTDAGILQSWIHEYFTDCEKNRAWKRPTDKQIDDAIEKGTPLDVYPPDLSTTDKHPSIIGLCVRLGVGWDCFNNYEQNEELGGTIKDAKEFIQSYNVQMLYTGSAFGTKFVLTNNFHWKEKKEIETINPARNDGGLSTALDLIREIKGSADKDSSTGTSEK